MKKFRIKKYQIYTNKIRNPEGIRFVLLADLHGFSYGRDNAGLIEAIRREKPAAVLSAFRKVNSGKWCHLLRFRLLRTHFVCIPRQTANNIRPSRGVFLSLCSFSNFSIGLYIYCFSGILFRFLRWLLITLISLRRRPLAGSLPERNKTNSC